MFWRRRVGDLVSLSSECPDDESFPANRIEELRRARTAAEARAVEAERGRRAIEAVLESIPMGLLVADEADARIRLASAYGGSLLGRPRGEALGHAAEELVAMYDVRHRDGVTPAQPEETPLVRVLRHGEVVQNDEWTVRKANGERIHILCNAAPVRNGDGRVTSAVLAWRDISSWKGMEMEMRRTMRMAEEASRAKSDFLANMSHEIRTPMNGIVGLTDLALTATREPKVREYLGLVKESCASLLGIVNDLLDLSKIEAGKLAIARSQFPVREFVRSTLEPLAVCAGKKGVTLSHSVQPDVPDQVVGDQLRLRQVLGNIAGNAVKFTGQGTVTVSVMLDNERSTPGTVGLLFRVSDTGIGIPEEKLATIFESFSQAAPLVSAQYGGTGLGLPIAKKLLALMDGEIQVTSKVGRGSTFTFSALLGTAATRVPPPPPPPPAPRMKRLRVLLAEDNIINRILATELLTRRGHDVVSAECGREALELLRLERFDLVLMDVRMPGMDGLEATHAIRTGEAGDANSTIPIIALTAHALAGDRERFIAAGMNEHIAKPIDPESLDKALASVLCRP